MSIDLSESTVPTELRPIVDLQQQVAAEKAARLKYQDLAYSAMVTIDHILGMRPAAGSGCNVENFTDKLKEVVLEVSRLRSDLDQFDSDLNEGRLIRVTSNSTLPMAIASITPGSSPAVLIVQVGNDQYPMLDVKCAASVKAIFEEGFKGTCYEGVKVIVVDHTIRPHLFLLDLTKSN